MTETLVRIEKLLLQLDQRMTVMENEIKLIKESTNNMDNHINFVENIYEKVKYPFHQMIAWVSEEPNVLLLED